jgi:hypothetical protein
MLGGDTTFYKAARLVRKIMPTYLHKGFRHLLITDLDPISAADREWLREQFREDDEELLKLIGMSLLD